MIYRFLLTIDWHTNNLGHRGWWNFFFISYNPLSACAQLLVIYAKQIVTKDIHDNFCTEKSKNKLMLEYACYCSYYARRFFARRLCAAPKITITITIKFKDVLSASWVRALKSERQKLRNIIKFQISRNDCLGRGPHEVRKRILK